MVIRTPQQRFEVVQVLSTSTVAEFCTCRDLNQQRGQTELLARFWNRGLCEGLLPILVNQPEQGTFRDLLGMFTRDGELYARFAYTEAPLLGQRITDESLGLKTRLEIAGNLLERMALLNMPPAVQMGALEDRNVTVDDALRVRFNYVLSSLGEQLEAGYGDVSCRTAQLIRQLFVKELTAQSVPELEGYLAKMQAGAYTGYIGMYSDYDRVRKELLLREVRADMEPQTWLFRMWEKIKSLSRFVRPVLAGLLVVASCLYLIYTLLEPTQPKGTPVIFEQIGTVDIETGTNVPQG